MITIIIADFPPNWTAGSSSISAKMGIKVRDCIKSCWYLQRAYSMTYDEQVRGRHIHDLMQSRTCISISALLKTDAKVQWGNKCGILCIARKILAQFF